MKESPHDPRIMDSSIAIDLRNKTLYQRYLLKSLYNAQSFQLSVSKPQHARWYLFLEAGFSFRLYEIRFLLFGWALRREP